MKKLDKAIALLEKGKITGEGQTIAQILKLLAAAQRQVERMEETIAGSVEILSFIRFQTWPTIGLGINLKPHVIDEVLIPGERVLNSIKRG
jgi:hypothetical protein